MFRRLGLCHAVLTLALLLPGMSRANEFRVAGLTPLVDMPSGPPKLTTDVLSRTTQVVTIRDVEVLTTTLHSFLRDFYPRFRPEKTAIVLPMGFRVSPRSFGPFPPVGDKDTSPLLMHLALRNFSPIDLTKLPVSDHALLMSYEQAVGDSETREGQTRLYVHMWLPGFSDDGKEAVVYAWSSGTDRAYGLNGRGALYYLMRSGACWKVCGVQFLWES
jgi:hypothetical protein